jgi:hypothetical protein
MLLQLLKIKLLKPKPPLPTLLNTLLILLPPNPKKQHQNELVAKKTKALQKVQTIG